MRKLHKKTKSSSLYTYTVHRGQNLNLSFLLSPKYNTFCSTKLHIYRIQHCLPRGIFFQKNQNVQMQISRASISGLHGAQAPNIHAR
jgi:hypothetical protein